MVLNAIGRPQSSASGVFPGLVLVQGNEQKNIVLNRTPFSVGRKIDKDLVIADPRVSRDHALIVLPEEDGLFLVDQGSKHGTFVNGNGSPSGQKLGAQTTAWSLGCATLPTLFSIRHTALRTRRRASS